MLQPRRLARGFESARMWFVVLTLLRPYRLAKNFVSIPNLAAAALASATVLLNV